MHTNNFDSKQKISKQKNKGKAILFLVLAILAGIIGIILISRSSFLRDSVTMGDPDWFEVSSQASSFMFGGVATTFVAIVFATVSITLFSEKKIKNQLTQTIEQTQEIARKTLTEEQRREISEKMHQTNRHMSNYFAGVVECKNCGNEVSPGERKCKYCGTRIR